VELPSKTVLSSSKSILRTVLSSPAETSGLKAPCRLSAEGGGTSVPYLVARVAYASPPIRRGVRASVVGHGFGLEAGS